MSILRGLDIYGWDEIENIILAALANESNLLIVGEKGGGKTYAARRISQAFDAVRKNRDQNPFRFTKIDGFSANEEDLVGYALPPSHKMMEEAEAKKEPVYMKFVLSPNTIALADMILIDEATRIPREMQNRYLSVLDFRIVDGYKLPARFIWGAANPITYSATETMDEALADRWSILVHTPNLREMGEADRAMVLSSQARSIVNMEPDLAAAEELVRVVEKAQGERVVIISSSLDTIVSYTSSMISSINESILKNQGSASKSAFTTCSPIDGRRGAIIVNNIVGIHAVSRAKGLLGTLKHDALAAFLNSLVHELHGDDPVDSSVIKNAHQVHQAILDSAEDRVISEIEKVSDPVARVAKAIELDAKNDVVSAYATAAYNDLKESDEIRAAAYAYVMLSGLQHGNGLFKKFNRNALDPLWPEVERTLHGLEDIAVTLEGVDFSKSGASDAALRLLRTIKPMQATAAGRAAIGIASLSLNEASGPTAGGLNPDDVLASRYNKIITSLAKADKAVADMVTTLKPMLEV